MLTRSQSNQSRAMSPSDTARESPRNPANGIEGSSNVAEDNSTAHVGGAFSGIFNRDLPQIGQTSDSSISTLLQSLLSAQETNVAHLVAAQREQMDEMRQMFQQVLSTTLSKNQDSRLGLAGSGATVNSRRTSSTQGYVASEESPSARATPNVQQDTEDFQDYITCSERAGGTRRRLQEASLPTQYWPPQDPSNHYGEMSHNPIPINQIEPPRFNGDKSQARTWLRKYEGIMNINGYNDLQKFRRARAYLDGEAQQWYNAIIRLNPDADWYHLKTSLLRHFCGVDGAAALRRKLAEARQKPGEHPSSYLFRIIDACMEYNPNMPDLELLQRTCAGLNDSTYNVLAAVKDKEDWTIDWIKARFEQFKLTLERPSREVPPAESRPPKRRNPSTSAVPKVRDLSTWTCFNRSETGHLMENCSRATRNASRSALKHIELRSYRATARIKMASRVQNSVL